MMTEMLDILVTHVGANGVIKEACVTLACHVTFLLQNWKLFESYAIYYLPCMVVTDIRNIKVTKKMVAEGAVAVNKGEESRDWNKQGVSL